MSGLVKLESIKNLIIEVREQSVLLDSNVADIYCVEVKSVLIRLVPKPTTGSWS